MYTVRKRRKRAGEQDLYRTCRVIGNCPPDIKAKFEQNTLADKILKYGSTAVYFGGLGIGTGSGSGRTGPGTIGRGGGISLGSEVTVGRPDLPINTLGPESIVPVDAVDPLGPAIIPPERFPGGDFDFPRFPIATDEDPFILAPPRFPTAVEDPPPLPGGEIGGGEVSTVPDLQNGQEPAVILVHPETVSRTQYHNPTFEISVMSGGTSGETSAADNVFVTHSTDGVIVGGDTEFIPLREIPSGRPRAGAEVEETGFMTSTPERVETVVRRRPGLLNRRFQQVPVRDTAFLDRPGTLVSFDNPAFEDDVTLIFEQDIESVAAAPHPDFTDVVRLGRPIFQRTDQGLRVSRVGQRGTISTRSGVRIGAQVHFYHDISGIEPVDSIELRSLGEQSQQGEIVVGDQGFEEVSLSESLLSSVPESEILDDLHTTVGDNVQLIVTFDSSSETSSIVPVDVTDTDLVVRRPPHFYPGSDAVFVYYPETNHGSGKVIPDDIPPIFIRIVGGSLDYDIHPSLIRRKRKRSYF